MVVWVWVAWIFAIVWLLRTIPVWYGLLWPQDLRDIAPAEGGDLPSVSLIVPARDEARAIEKALRTMLTLDYPRMEIIAINDRSTDGTGAIMDRVAAEDARLKVAHVETLPAGWLGKNHAAHIGVQAASGDFLLLTDGDILFDPQILRRAMRLVDQRRLDHLVLLPDPLAETFWEKVLINFFMVMLLTASQAAFARCSWAKKAYLGVGAFNLLRRSAYVGIGGHEPLRMEVADDVCLGKLIKQGGYRQDVFIATEYLKVKWQHGGLWGIVRGLEKNSFAAMNFSVGQVLFGCTMLGLALIVPPVLAIIGPTELRVPMALMAIANLLMFVITAWRNRTPLLTGVLHPIGAALFILTILRSTAITLRAGGIRWRDTFYPLEELRKGKVR